MPQTQIVGGLTPSYALAVDPQFMAGRIAMKPLEYLGAGVVLGHYAVGQTSGATVNLTSSSALASMRWTDLTRFLVLMRVRVGWSITAAITAATPMDLRGSILRSFTVDYASNRTVIDMTSVTNTNKMRAGMGTSLMGAAGPRICTTTGMTGQTLVADAFVESQHIWPSLVMTNGTGAVVTQSAGAAGEMADLYDWRNAGQNPVVLAANEGYGVFWSATAGPTTGTVQFYVSWEWAEVQVF